MSSAINTAYVTKDKLPIYIQRPELRVIVGNYLATLRNNKKIQNSRQIPELHEGANRRFRDLWTHYFSQESIVGKTGKSAKEYLITRIIRRMVLKHSLEQAKDEQNDTTTATYILPAIIRHPGQPHDCFKQGFGNLYSLITDTGELDEASICIHNTTSNFRSRASLTCELDDFQCNEVTNTVPIVDDADFSDEDFEEETMDLDISNVLPSEMTFVEACVATNLVTSVDAELDIFTNAVDPNNNSQVMDYQIGKRTTYMESQTTTTPGQTIRRRFFWGGRF